MSLTNEQYTEILHVRIEKLEEAVQLMCDAVSDHAGYGDGVCDRCDGYRKAVALWKESDALAEAARA